MGTMMTPQGAIARNSVMSNIALTCKCRYVSLCIALRFCEYCLMWVGYKQHYRVDWMQAAVPTPI